MGAPWDAFDEGARLWTSQSCQCHILQSSFVWLVASRSLLETLYFSTNVWYVSDTNKSSLIVTGFLGSRVLHFYSFVLSPLRMNAKTLFSWIHYTDPRNEHSKTEFGKKNSEKKFRKSILFPQANLIWRLAWWVCAPPPKSPVPSRSR